METPTSNVWRISFDEQLVGSRELRIDDQVWLLMSGGSVELAEVLLRQTYCRLGGSTLVNFEPASPYSRCFLRYWTRQAIQKMQTMISMLVKGVGYPGII